MVRRTYALRYADCLVECALTWNLSSARCPVSPGIDLRRPSPLIVTVDNSLVQRMKIDRGIGKHSVRKLII